MSVSHKCEDSFVFVVATDSCGNVVSFRDSREIAPLVFFRRVVKVVSLFEPTNENELFFTVLLDRNDCGPHAAFGHFCNFYRFLEFITIIELELVALFDESLIGKLEGVVVELIEHDKELEVNFFELKLLFAYTLGCVSSNLEDFGALEIVRVFAPLRQVEFFAPLDKNKITLGHGPSGSVLRNDGIVHSLIALLNLENTLRVEELKY